MAVIKKLFDAKKQVASMKKSKEGENSFSKYSYFTPEQVNKIVQEACEQNNILTKFDLCRNEFWVYGTLTVYDISEWDWVEFKAATEIPEIKATNAAQQLGWCMTYTERYLKMTAFWIVDNSLDFDTTENTKAFAGKKTVVQDLDRFEKAKQATKFMQECLDEEDFINKIKSKYKPTKQQETDLRICYQNAKAMENIDLPFSD